MNHNDIQQNVDYNYLTYVVLVGSISMLIGFVFLFGMYLSGAVLLAYILLSNKFKSNYTLLLKSKQPFTKLIMVWRNYILIVGAYVYTSLLGMGLNSYVSVGTLVHMSTTKSVIERLFVPILASHMVLYIVTAFIMGIFIIVSAIYLIFKPFHVSNHEQ